jgi:rsbT co-antagonist protein RsbR
LSLAIPAAETLLRGCPTPLALVSAGGELVATNAAWDARVGAGPLEGLVHEDDREALVTAREASLAGDATRLADVRLPRLGARARLSFWRADERAAWVAAEPLPDPDKERKARILVDTFDVMDANIWSCDLEGTVLASDGNGLKHLGLVPGEMVGMNIFQVFPPGSAAHAVVERTLSGESFFYEDVTEHAHWLNVYTPLRDAEGEVLGLQSISVNFGKDLALAKRAKAIAESVDRLPIIIWAVDKGGVCTLISGALAPELGLRPDELIGKNMLEMFADRQDITAHIRRTLAGEEHVVELSFGDRFVRTRYVPTRGPFGEIIGLSAATEDATDQRRIEAQLREQVELIEEQRRAIAELGTPIIEVWQDVLAVPVVGTIDAARAEGMLSALLDAIMARRARFAILDLTGVETVDAATAEHLVRVVEAARLLGCEGVITGIRPSVAGTLVDIGAELSKIRTLRSLKDALRFCAGRGSGVKSS